MFRVRRSSDSAEQDIGFSGGLVDTAALLSFTGAGDGFVTTWYDQSGNGYHATQTVAAEQYRIVDSGSVTTGTHGKPALQNTSADSFFMDIPLAAVTNGNVNRSFGLVFSIASSLSTLMRIVTKWDTVGFIEGVGIAIDSARNDLSARGADAGAVFPILDGTSNALSTTTKQGGIVKFTDALPFTMSVEVFGDVANTVTGNGVSVENMNLQNAYIGQSTSSVTKFDGDLSELIYWESAISAGDETIYKDSVTEAFF